MYLRRQDDFFESLYTQYVHIGEKYSFSTFLNDHEKSNFNWYNLLKNYAACFGKENIIVRSYDKLYLENIESIYKDFGSIVGVTDDMLQKMKTVSKTNIGYSRDALEVALICNKNLNKQDQNLLRIILQNSNCKNVFENYSFFNWEERKLFMSKYLDSNQKILNEYFRESKGDLFSVLEYTEDIYGKFSLERLTKVVMNIEINNYRKNQNSSRIVNFLINSENKAKKYLLKFYKNKKIKK